MTTTNSLAMTAQLHERVRRHLFPGDGLEAAAILLCARTPGPRVRLLVRDALLVPHDQCARQPNHLSWPGSAIEKAVDQAERDNLSLVLLHSHPGGFFAFSELDDQSDQATMPGLFQALGPLHGSAIMVPDGAILARLYEPDLQPRPIELVTVPSDDLRWWWADGQFASRPMAFTGQTRTELARLCACVIGVSGTGSIVAEQLARLGFGRVLLIDFDHVEERNLNRILNSTLDDAAAQRPKVEVFARAITSFRGPDVALPLSASIVSREAVLLASQADVLFSCVDSLDGRQIADQLGSAFLLPLFDVGVTIPTRRTGEGLAIGDVCARIDYVRPGGPTLQDRGIYSPDALRAEYLRRTAPDAHKQEVAAGYLRGTVEQAPSVISLNMRAAADLVMEFMARAYPFRHDSNKRYARRQLSIAAGEEEFFSENEFPKNPNPMLARGGLEPLLGLPVLGAPRK